MATLADFDIARLTPGEVSSIKDAEKLTEVYEVATNDGIYRKLKGPIAEYFKDMVDLNSGILQVARLKNDETKRVVGIALFKLRFRGPRDSGWKFVATAQQRDLHASIFATEAGDVRPVVREFTGDPVLTRFKECLETDGQKFTVIDEDILSRFWQNIDSILLCSSTDKMLFPQSSSQSIFCPNFNMLQVWHKHWLPQS
jgi:hypothetical protein